MNNDILIRRETEKDYRTVEELIRDSFFNVYHPGAMEHYVMHRYRSAEGFVPELDLVMEKDGVIIGQVMYAESEIVLDSGDKLPIMTFGPICIATGLKRQGYGKMLLDYSMTEAAKLGCGALAITGNIAFYGKSGFVTASTKGVRYAFAEEGDRVVPYFLIKELKTGFLDGVSGTYADPAPYFVCQNEPEAFEAFDATFPPREKLVLPGQLDH